MSGAVIVAGLDRARAAGVLASPRRVGVLYAAAFVALALVHLQSLDAVYPASGTSIAAWDARQSNPWILAPQAIILTLLFGVYLIVLLRWERLRFSSAQVLRMGLGAGAAAALALPANSWDLFAYIGFGRMAVIHGLNPYVTSYRQIVDAYSPYGWASGQMNYGPVVLPAFMAAGLVAEVSVVAALYLLKVLWLAVHLGAAWVLDRVLKEAGHDPGYGLFVFALNPLLLFELLVNGHNDGLMILCATLALAALQRGRGAAALTIALLGALVKFPGVVLCATIAVYLIRRRHWRRLASGAAGSALVAIGVVLLFFPEPRAALVLLDRTPGNSLYTEVAEVVAQGAAMPHDVMLRGGLRLVLMGALALFCAWRVIKIGDLRGVVRETAYIIVATLVAFQGSIYPWYVTWIFPFVALLDSARARYVLLTYSWTILGTYCLYPPLRFAEFFQGSMAGRQLRRALVHGVLVGLLVRRVTFLPLARWSLLRSGR